MAPGRRHPIWCAILIVLTALFRWPGKPLSSFSGKSHKLGEIMQEKAYRDSNHSIDRWWRVFRLRLSFGSKLLKGAVHGVYLQRIGEL